MAARMSKYEALSYERLLYLLSYDPRSGEFTRLVPIQGGIKAGTKAGSLRPDGYMEISIDRCKYFSHVLAVFWMTGEWPVEEIDHRDLNRLNNKWNNLREATSHQNKGNTPLYKNNTSGAKGVHWSREKNKWVAQITKGDKCKFLGYYKDFDSAANYYAKAAEEIFGEFARLR